MDPKEKLAPDGVPPQPPKYISPREQKRSRKEAKGKQAENNEAGSEEERRQAQ